MSRREVWGMIMDSRAGVIWFVDYGNGPEKWLPETTNFRNGVILSWCPL